MKTKILVSALICASFGYVNAETIPPATHKEKVVSETHQTDKTQKKFSNKDEPINSRNFDTKSKAEQDQYINEYIGGSNESFSKFNLTTLIEPNLPDNELKIKEEKINEMLLECAKIIGPEDWERQMKLKYKNYDFFNEEPFKAIFENFEDEPISSNFMERAQFHHLSNKFFKCVRYLYQDPDKNSIYVYYNTNDFEYKRVLSAKEKKVEDLYEKIYLAVKEAGLLRKMDHAYYPKSLLRQHADKTGLTGFIKQQENRAKHPLKHDELAAQFFGLREAWLVDLHKYFEQPIGNKKEIINDRN